MGGQKSSVEWRQILFVRTKWPPTPLDCSKNSLRGVEEKVFSLQRGGGEKYLASRKKMRLFALTMAAPDLISESLQWTSGYRVRSRNDKHMVNKEQMVNKETNVRPRDSPTDLLMYRAHGEWIWRTYGGRAWGSTGSLPARNRAQSSKHG